MERLLGIIYPAKFAGLLTKPLNCRRNKDFKNNLRRGMALAKWGAVLERTLNTTMQTTMKKTIGLLVCGLVLGATHLTAADEPNYRAVTIGVDAGTTGFGGSASLRFSDHLGIRGGVNFLSYDTDEFTYTTKPNGIASEDLKFTGSLRLLSAPVALDYYPSTESAFRISFGVLVNQNQFSADVRNSGVPNSTYTFNGVDYLQSAVGDLEMEVEQQTLSPYLSIGTSFYFGKSKRWALSGELGVAYTGSPKVSITAPNHDPALDLTPNFADDVSGEEAKIEKDAEDYKFYPIVKIGVSYSF